MEKTILCFMLAFVGLSLNAQIYVDGNDIATVANAKYIQFYTEIKVREKADAIIVDYGSENFNTRDKNYLTDSKGMMLIFKTVVGALNYFEEHGWEYKDFLPEKGFTESGGRYLIKRKE